MRCKPKENGICQIKWFPLALSLYYTLYCMHKLTGNTQILCRFDSICWALKTYNVICWTNNIETTATEKKCTRCRRHISEKVQWLKKNEHYLWKWFVHQLMLLFSQVTNNIEWIIFRLYLFLLQKRGIIILTNSLKFNMYI